MVLSCLITLWQGTKSGIGFNLHAVPTALTALGIHCKKYLLRMEAV